MRLVRDFTVKKRFNRPHAYEFFTVKLSFHYTENGEH